jgi:hypothetical protein
MIKTTQKVIKEFMRVNGVIDITRSENPPRPDKVLFYSAGVYGVNGAVYSAGGRLYGTSCRCSNVFIVL